MTDLWQRLKQRKLVQWTVAYIAAAFALLQGIDIVAQQFGWPAGLQRGITLAMVLGFLVVLVLAWYHGERGEQKVTSIELLVLAAILAVGGGMLWRYAQTGHQGASASVATNAPAQPASAKTAAEPTSIAVLPFLDLSQAHDQEYFSDGLSEELLNMLAQLPQLRVIARTSSFSFKGKEVDIATIAEKLNVANVLEGSVRKDGNKLRITAQLIRASDSSHLWSRTYDRELTDIFKVQDEIAGAVVDVLKIKLLPKQQLTNPYRSDDTEAYNDYLLGIDFSNRENPEGWRKAIVALHRAIARSADYASAYAALGSAEGKLSDSQGDTAGARQARIDVEKSIALAPRLADGYSVRGTMRLIRRDLAGAQADYEHALLLNANSSVAQIGYVRLQVARGRLPEAIVAARDATELDPLNSGAWALLGRLLVADSQFPSARQALGRALDISPESNRARYDLGIVDLLEGKDHEAVTMFGKFRNGYGLTGIAMAEHSLGHARESQDALDENIAKFAGGAAYQIAEAYAWRGEKDLAFSWLERAYAQNDGGLTFIRVDPLLKNIRDDPRFAVLLQKMVLPE